MATDDDWVVGIDLGTTAVKVAVVEVGVGTSRDDAAARWAVGRARQGGPGRVRWGGGRGPRRWYQCGGAGAMAASAVGGGGCRVCCRCGNRAAAPLLPGCDLRSNAWCRDVARGGRRH